ncbi:TMEM175 family protein [Microbacterium sp.]|uniref:TMEM175 family protein n=1 Tax=Microbacterium sp. TaxID=51671 RepID=UPI00262C8576|nr:TMEM175 family protein [Microbacterium sp.]
MRIHSEGLLRRDSAEFDRGVSFYDAVYGFAVTLLIANVDAPPAEAWQDLSSLLATGVLHQLGGFALSFIVIAVFWRINVKLVQRISAMDAATTAANLAAAAFVILIPFTTQGISDPGSAEFALPTVFYAANIAVVSLLQLGVFEVARARGLEIEPLTKKEHRRFVLDALPTSVVFLASIPVALLWSPEAGKLTWLALIVIGPLTARLLQRGAVSQPED